MNEDKVELKIQGLTNSQIQAGAYALVLSDLNGYRRIPIIVGMAEAQSIAIALQHVNPPRPLTHDLFASFCKSFGIVLREVFIYRFEDGVYYSEMTFENGTDKVRIDSRTSDAIALAMRMKCPIFTTSDILNKCGVKLEDEEEVVDNESVESDDYLTNMEPEDIKDDEQMKKWLSLLELDDLNERLEEAINQENYEYAKMFKDEIFRREEKKNIKGFDINI